MKKQRFIISLTLCLLLSLSFLLTSCSDGTIGGANQVTILDIATDGSGKPTPTYTRVEDLQLDGIFMSGKGKYFYTQNYVSSAAKYTVYDIETLTPVYTYSDLTNDAYSFSSFEFFENADFFVMVLSSDSSYETRLIDKTGKTVATEQKSVTLGGNENLFSHYGLFTFDGDAYKQTDDGVTLIRESHSGRTDFDNVIIYGNKYFWIDFSKGEELSHIVAYDTNLNPVTEYRFPSYAERQSVFALANDRIFIQYLVSVDSHVVEYDVMIDGQKYDVYQFVYTTESKIVNSVEINGLVASCTPYYTDESPDMDAPYSGFKEGRISSLAVVIPITHRNLNTLEYTYCNMGDNGLISEIIRPAFGSATVSISVLADNRFVIFNEFIGASQIIDKSGKVYGSFDSFDNINDSFIEVDGIIYNFDFEKIYTIKNSDKITFAQHSVYIQSKTSDNFYDFYLLKSGDKVLGKPLFSYSETNNKKLVTDSLYQNIYVGYNEAVSEYVYVVKTVGTNNVFYEYFSENGTLLSTVATPYEILFSSPDGSKILLSLTDENETLYFLMK